MPTSAVSIPNRSPGDSRVEPFIAAVIKRQNIVLDCLFQECGLQLLQLFGVFRGKIDRTTEVVCSVVEFPLVLIEGSCPWLEFPRRLMHGEGVPAVLVDAAIADELSLLDCVR
jgi:hypothetical protein